MCFFAGEYFFNLGTPEKNGGMGVGGVSLCLFMRRGILGLFCRAILLAPLGVGVPSGWALSGQKVGG